MSDRDDYQTEDNLVEQVRETLKRSQAALAEAAEVFPDPSKPTEEEREACRISDAAVAGAQPSGYQPDAEAPFRAADDVRAAGGSDESALAAAIRSRFSEPPPRR